MTESIKSLLARGALKLKDSKARKYERDARILLSLALGREKVFILAHPEFEVDKNSSKRYLSYVKRRAEGEPVQYITGIQPFWTTEVKVGRGCLIPRPETEVLVEQVLELAQGLKAPMIFDLGCGSGAILKAVAESLKACRLFGLEKDGKALKWARSNLDSYNNVTLIKGDFRKTPPMNGIDIIVSNPPYLSQKEFDRLPVEIKDHEPVKALLATDPMEPYRAIARFAGKALKEGGHLVLELGSEQAKRHRAFLKLSPDLELVHFKKDLGGKLRAVVFRLIKISPP